MKIFHYKIEFQSPIVITPIGYMGEVINAIKEDALLVAIKVYKLNNNCTLKEARDYVINVLKMEAKNKKLHFKKKLYTMSDMVEFGRFVYDITKPSIHSIDMHVLDNWIQKAHPEDCVNFKK